MTLKYEIDKYELDLEDNTKTKVGFKITNDNGKVLIIDKSVTTGSNTAEQIVAAAQANAQAEIDAWDNAIANVGKTWNPETNSFE